PSPLTSPTATEEGTLPASNASGATKPGLTRSSQRSRNGRNRRRTRRVDGYERMDDLPKTRVTKRVFRTVPQYGPAPPLTQTKSWKGAPRPARRRPGGRRSVISCLLTAGGRRPGDTVVGQDSNPLTVRIGILTHSRSVRIPRTSWATRDSARPPGVVECDSGN